MAVTDTLRSQAGEDSIVTRQAWHYLPDDVLLTWFNENYKPQYLRDYERTDAVGDIQIRCGNGFFA